MLCTSNKGKTTQQYTPTIQGMHVQGGWGETESNILLHCPDFQELTTNY